MNVAIYLRVSSKQQAERQLPIPAQRGGITTINNKYFTQILQSYSSQKFMI